MVDVFLDTNPSPPISGTVSLNISLVDGERKPIEGAKITISPLMPAHAHINPDAVAQPCRANQVSTPRKRTDKGRRLALHLQY